jgi:hypothetical protein
MVAKILLTKGLLKGIFLTLSLSLCISFAMASPTKAIPIKTTPAKTIPAKATPAKAESIEQMLIETDAKNMIAQMVYAVKPAIEQQTVQAAKEMLQKDQLSANELAIVMQMQEILFEEMAASMSWDTMKTLMIEGYRETFSEEEIQASLKFYRTPEGKSIMQKMPQLMQHFMQNNQNRWSNFAPSEKAVKELQVLREKLIQANS